jgi:glycosyltransferase involved in cell wall biosynthesis
MGRAACLLHPSAREGYGLVVVEACVRGTPVILVEDPENAATELIEPGVNGYVAKSSDPIELSVLLVAVLRAGDSMRKSTIDWYRRRSGELSIDSSVQVIEAAYCERLDIADQVDKRGKSW